MFTMLEVVEGVEQQIVLLLRELEVMVEVEMEVIL